MNLERMCKTKLTIFHCINVFGNGAALPAIPAEKVELNFVKMPCSSMVKDIFLLRAFEAGADAVLVLVCAEGTCRYVEGNLRAAKRVKRVQALLDEIGFDGRRLSLFNIVAGEAQAVEQAIREVKSIVVALGANPAARPRPLPLGKLQVIKGGH
ncbi:MAG: hydrogenase iron-sulfur subunit [Desulfobacteraceae bacterium]|nr:MAG: hydrogenase iron-sulfur subunit [Desulfobacteraceae bacterium]